MANEDCREAGDHREKTDYANLAGTGRMIALVTIGIERRNARKYRKTRNGLEQASGRKFCGANMWRELFTRAGRDVGRRE